MSKTPIDFEIIWKQIHGTIDADEQEILATWLAESPQNKAYFDKVVNEYKGDSQPQKINEDLAWSKIRKKALKRSSTGRRWLYPAAASFLILCVSLLIWKINQPIVPLNEVADESEPIVPGSNKALLITSTGESIELDQNNSLNVDNGNISIYSDGESITYQDKSDEAFEEAKNTLVIPRGGKFSLTLSDGSRVWMNSATTLTYPVEFGSKDRVVELQGEAYFDIAHDPEKPFKVISKEQTTTVLGTKFNVSSYTDIITTTLVEGSVRVNVADQPIEILLEPGHQVSYNTKDRSANTNKVDTELYTAWKDNLFMFENQRLDVILNRLSRWYDVDVFYDNDAAKNVRFTGEIKCNEDIRFILGLIEKTQAVKFDIKKRTVIVK
ncbi:DUF4974 domain-containing protein [Fulvivirgaceae bacterium BMA10]|uniref:DUF4974 domain-containing protein n=1 Tax=Splendidivirga corallicola TaxID=3051826 RepID=A0ABT8KNX8_9BACT|nr:DUF4974 domain-containing protein [Fulvivirgaceae bacterium BMA10]